MALLSGISILIYIIMTYILVTEAGRVEDWASALSAYKAALLIGALSVVSAVVEAMHDIPGVVASVLYIAFFVLLVRTAYRRVGPWRSILGLVLWLAVFAVGKRLALLLARHGVVTYVSAWSIMYRGLVVSGEVPGGASLVHVALALLFCWIVERLAG